MKGVNRSWRRTDTRLTSVEDEVGTNNNGISGSLTTPTQRRERFEQVPDANRYEMMKQEREKLRQQYIKRGLIQDPDQKIDLRNAIKFVGTCQDMCPAFEREEREYQKSIDKLERRAGTTDRIDHSRAVKTFHRPAAGNEQPLPCDVRPPIILERTLSYLIYDIVMTHGVENTHFFVRDRMRSIRQDYTLQNERGISAITVHEKIARYHIACSHLLCETPSFSESQEMEQLRKVLQSLHEFYDDAAINGLKCENEAEFRSYHLVAHLGDKDILRQAQFYPADIVQSPLVQHALKFHALYQQEGSFQMIDMIRFFRLVAHPTTSFLTACLLEHFFIKIRKSGLAILRNAVNLRQKPSIPVERFVSMFSFTDYTELEEFCQFFGMTLNDNQVILSQDDTSTTSTAVTSAFSTSIPGSASQSPFMTGIGSPFETNDTTSTEKKVNPLPRRKNVQLVTVKMTDSLASYIEQPHFPSDPHAYDVVWPPAILSSTTSFVKQEFIPPVTLPPTALSSSLSSSMSMPSKSPFSFAPFGVAGSTNNISKPIVQPPASMSFGFNNNANVITNQTIPATSMSFNPPSMTSNPGIINQQTTSTLAVPAVPTAPVKVKREPPPIKEIAQDIVNDMVQQQLTSLLTSVWTQSREEAKKEDQVIRQRAAQDITSELVQQLLQNILTGTISDVRRQVDISEVITRTSREMVHSFLDKALLTTIAKLVAETRVKASLYRWTIQRWRAAYQAREAQRIEQQRRIEQFRLNTSGIKLGPVRCDQLSLPLTEFHVVRDTTSTSQMATPMDETTSEDPWRPIDWSKQLSLLKLPNSNVVRQSCLWRLSVAVEEEDTLSMAWLEAKTLIESSSKDPNSNGITYLVSPPPSSSSSSSSTTTNKPIHKIVEPSAILFIGSDLSQVDENDKVSMSSYTIKQRERLRALTPTVHRNVPLLMVFWTNTGSAQEMAFVHRVTEQCTRDLVWKRCVILSGSESFHEFDRQIDWLMEHSYLYPVISWHELIHEYSDIFRWTCRRINQVESTYLIVPNNQHLPSEQRKRSTSVTDMSFNHTIDYVNLTIELFNNYLTTLEQVIYCYLSPEEQVDCHSFMRHLALTPVHELASLPGMLQRLLTSITWIPPTMSQLPANVTTMSHLLKELEPILLSMMEQYLKSHNVQLYPCPIAQQRLLSNFRLEAQHLLDSVERECQTIIIPLRSLEEPAIKKPRRVIATQSSLNDLRSLVHDVRDWLQQTEPSPPLS